MKTIKLLLAFVFCLAVAVPAMAQKIAKEEIGGMTPAVVRPQPEFCASCEVGNLNFDEMAKVGEKAAPVVNNSGQRGAFTYFVEGYGTEGWYAEMANEQKGYTLFIDRWVDGQGNLQIAKGCYGNEEFCKSFTNGKSCVNAAQGEWCYEPEEPMVAEAFVEMAR